MAPFSSYNGIGFEEEIDTSSHHHLVHLPEHHHKTLVETINSLLHAGSSHHNNGSHSGSGSSVNYSTTEEEISEDLLIILFTLVPIVVVVALIFLIAVAIRKMRRAESLQEVVRRNEFKTSNRIRKGFHSTNSNPLDSKKSKTNPPSPSSIHEIRVISAASRKAAQTLGTQLSLDSSASSSSSNVSQNPTNSTSLYFSQVPPWFLHSTSYYRSQYHLNKLHRQLGYNGGGSLHSFHHSMQSLNQSGRSESSSSDSGITTIGHFSDADEITAAEEAVSNSNQKKLGSKKLKKVCQAINFPKRIRQHQAEKNRFNIYTMPNETREQLKQIYVY